ncbi:prepilin-type N-terminal cleavage/methylation domain-containing protein [Paenibacillus sp. CF384]|uniref:type IV pilus modification PilV family protein n=1 Tax=Paenibacillus sp. CF384 TaxID=1884382 RepID=UPI00089D8E35|nr:prepilin-type N-terminal cleavage/methylation domain-containing protein [Paenibacillus sp. CF384]SDX96454.1 prepilin-type N-terminal cleavage/methylation domain-containing protein [Paenibacillus sp. CF384]
MKAHELQQPSRESGFTLVEILTCLIILSVAGLAMTGFFVHALSYAKGNQNKTVMVNLARNTLFYMQKQSNFDAITKFYKIGQPIGIGDDIDDIDSKNCLKDSGSCLQYESLFSDPQSLYYILNPEINGIAYRVKVIYQDELNDLDSTTDGNIGKYLIPIKVIVTSAPSDGEDVSSSKRESAEVEGYITDEAIR